LPDPAAFPNAGKLSGKFGGTQAAPHGIRIPNDNESRKEKKKNQRTRTTTELQSATTEE